MISTWTCICGVTHPLNHKYCNKCGRPIPQSTLDAVIKEETKMQRRSHNKKRGTVNK